MGTNSTSPPGYWGYLIKPDKSPSAIFEQLLLGIANYINRHVAPWDVDCLTPTKLAAFYRLVGGDLDPLFLETPQASLSFIYQSLGCYHTLQPERDPYTAPKLPALTPQGFVRWQTVQVLLDPVGHVSFLQNAVKRLEITNPVDGIPFPYPLPRDALPSRPDPEMLQWHKGVGKGLMVDSHIAAIRAPSAETCAEADGNTTESSIASSADHQTLVDTGRNCSHEQIPPFHPPPAISVPQTISAPPPSNSKGLPWDLERRRSSTSDLRYPMQSSKHQNHMMPVTYPNDFSLGRPRPESPSTASTSSMSSSDSSSLAPSSASVSPRFSNFHHPHPHRHHHPSQGQRSNHHERRHSPHASYPPRAVSETRNTTPRQSPDGRLLPQQPPKPPGSNSRGLNVRWGDINGAMNSPRGPIHAPDQEPMLRAFEPRRKSDEGSDRAGRARGGSGGRSASPLRGVGGRRYVAEGTKWS